MAALGQGTTYLLCRRLEGQYRIRGGIDFSDVLGGGYEYITIFRHENLIWISLGLYFDSVSIFDRYEDLD